MEAPTAILATREGVSNGEEKGIANLEIETHDGGLVLGLDLDLQIEASEATGIEIGTGTGRESGNGNGSGSGNGNVIEKENVNEKGNVKEIRKRRIS